MNWRVIIRPNAEADLQEAWSWYEAQRTGLGDELLDEIRRAVGLLETDPERRPFYYRDFRRLLTAAVPPSEASVLGDRGDRRKWPAPPPPPLPVAPPPPAPASPPS